MTTHSFWQQSLEENAFTTRKLSQLLLPGPDGVRLELGSTPLLVTAQAVPDMSVRVDTGWAKAGGYLGYNDAPVTVAIGVASAANPRIDLVVMRWRDTENGDATSSCTIEVIPGAAAAIPTAPSTVGMVVAVLAEVLVAAATTTIAGGAITDRRSLFTDAAYASAQKTAVQNIPNGVYTTITGWSHDGGIANVGYGSGIWTIQKAGYYTFQGHIAYAQPVVSSVGQRALKIEKNGVRVDEDTMRQDDSYNSYPKVFYGGLCVPGDTFEIMTYQSQGITQPLAVSDGWCRVALQRIGPAAA